LATPRGECQAPGDVDDRFGKSLRRFLRQIVFNAARDGPVLISAGEFLRIRARLRMRCTVGIPFKGNGGHADDRALSKSLFQIVKPRRDISLATMPKATKLFSMLKSNSA